MRPSVRGDTVIDHQLRRAYLMIRYHIDDLSDSMVLGESIMLPSGELLLGAGYKIKRRYRERLRAMGFEWVLVEEEGTEGVRPTTTVSESVQRDVLQNLSSASREMLNAFNHVRQLGVQAVEDEIRTNRQHLAKFIMSSGLQAALEKVMTEILSENGVVLNLSAIRQTGETLFAHTLNVAITSLCIGRKFHFAWDELKQLGIGALNYDLGLAAIPREIIDKQDELTGAEREKLKTHVALGYLMLQDNPAVPPTGAAPALQHHENLDGSGYPRGLKGENRPPLKDFSQNGTIHRFSQIVAVADQYEMLVSGRRHYCERVPAVEAIRRLILRGGRLLNAEIVRALVSIVPILPVGARIRVAQAPTPQLAGYSGVVARDNPANLEKPQIILYLTRKGQRIKPIIIDCAKHDGFVLELV